MANDKKAIKQIATGDRTIPPKDALMIPIYIMGREYVVPETLTIMKAIEYSGYRYVRVAAAGEGYAARAPRSTALSEIIS